LSEKALARATVVYVWFGIAVFLLLSAPTIFSADSFSYKDPTHRNLKMALQSLEGKWDRSPTIVVPFALLGSNTTIEYAQTVVLGLAFTFLILTVYGINAFGTVAKALLGFTLATMVLSVSMLSWNLQIASESLSVSYALVAFTASLRFLLRWEPKWLLLSGGAAMFAISAKATLGFIFVPLLAAEVIFFGWRTIAPRWRRDRPSSLPSLVASVGTVVGVCALVGTGILYVSMQDQSALRMGIGKEKDAIIHLISIEDPINTPIRHSLQATDIPKCVPLYRPVPYTRISPLEFQLTTSCPQFTSWSVHKYTAWYAGFLLNHPGDVRKLLADLLPYSVSFSLHEQGVFVAVPPVADVIWGTYPYPTAQVDPASPELPPLGFEDAVYVGVLAVNAAGIWLLASRRRRQMIGAQRHRLFWFFLCVVDGAVFVIVSQVLFLTNTGLGAERIALEANVLMRISLILTIGMAASWLWPLRPGGRSDPGDESSPAVQNDPYAPSA
jgi:hypothetical protein